MIILIEVSSLIIKYIMGLYAKKPNDSFNADYEKFKNKVDCNFSNIKIVEESDWRFSGVRLLKNEMQIHIPQNPNNVSNYLSGIICLHEFTHTIDYKRYPKQYHMKILQIISYILSSVFFLELTCISVLNIVNLYTVDNIIVTINICIAIILLFFNVYKLLKEFRVIKILRNIFKFENYNINYVKLNKLDFYAYVLTLSKYVVYVFWAFLFMVNF